jgi:hypothetical protein
VAPATVALAANMTGFVERMAAAGYAPQRYERAHASMFLTSLGTWATRCALLNNGTLPRLPAPASEQAADALFVATAEGLGAGLVTVLEGYAGSADPDQRAIYNIFMDGA